MSLTNPFQEIARLVPAGSDRLTMPEHLIRAINQLMGELRGYGALPGVEFWTSGWVHMTALSQLHLPHTLSGLPSLVQVLGAGSATPWVVFDVLRGEHFHDQGGSQYGVFVIVAYHATDGLKRYVYLRAGNYPCYYDPTNPDGIDPAVGSMSWQTSGWLKVNLWR